MKNKLFQQFLKAAQKDDKVSWDPEVSWQYSEILDAIYDDVAKFKNYTHDGRFQDVLAEVLKNKKYETEGYESLLKDLEEELDKFVETNIMLLPINFLDREKFKGDEMLNEYMSLFLPTKTDLLDVNDDVLRKRQEKRQRDKKGKYNDNLCSSFEKILNKKLDKEHILLVKDRNFFNYPILFIKIKSINFKVEKMSGRIAQAVYSILRMIDILNNQGGYDDWRGRKIPPAQTYTVYYNNEYYNKFEKFNSRYYGYSFKFNFSPLLDINTSSFINYKDVFIKATDLYIKSIFLDTKKYNKNQLLIIKKWTNALLMFNTIYELASIERYDACNLILCSLLESFFLKNEGRNKQERLKTELKEYLTDVFDLKNIEKIISSFQNVYHYRNKIMHEGDGYEARFTVSKRLTSYQGLYIGMKPFSRSGAIYPNQEIMNIKEILECVANILLCDKTLKTIEETINI